MKWRNLILTVLLVPVLLYGALRGYLWYSINSTVNHIQSRVGGFATLGYDEIRSPVLGPIGVTGITYTPHGFSEPVDDRFRLCALERASRVVGSGSSFLQKHFTQAAQGFHKPN